jgi:uncharacterized protein with PQ loop repeat
MGQASAETTSAPRSFTATSMIDGTGLAGFVGTTLVIVAYVPQIHHLIKERCTGGISLKAYCLWFAAALLLMTHAIGIQDPVFIMLQGYQLAACGLIVFFCMKYRGAVCETHRHPQLS